jgi:DNA-binding NarL/FixJ family response regulator
MNVLVIDDHPLILSAMQSLVRRLAEDVNVTAAASAQAARDALAEGTDFDLALLDLQLGDDNGFDLLADVRMAYPALPVVVVAASDHRDDVMRAIDLGAMGFVPKFTSIETLLGALSMVLSGGIYLPPSVMRGSSPPRPSHTSSQFGGWSDRLDDEKAAATLATLGLTTRQKEVLTLLLRGQSNKLIARALNLSVETIKDHVAAVLRLLQVSNRTQVVVAISRMSNAGPVPTWREPPRALRR